MTTDVDTDSQPAESQPAESQPAESQPAESQPAESQPAESQPAESQPAESQPADAKDEPVVERVNGHDTYRKRARTDTKPLVVIREVTKSFLHMGRALEVLKGIDLEIHEGEVVAIVGKSGAGKSTLLQCIGTLDTITSGIIRLGDEYMVGLSRADLANMRNRMIGFVFQFHHLLPEFNALENVIMPGLIQGLPRAAMEKRGRELLTDVGLDHRETHRPGELSGGEQQRVALARALLLKPKLILADEPTGNLDTATSDAIHKLFFDINEKHGTTIIVVTHNLKLAESMPRVIRMLDGRVDQDTDPPDSRFEVDPAVLERSRAIAKVRYPGFWERAAARAVDYAFLGMIGLIGQFIFVLIAAGESLSTVASAGAVILLLSPFLTPLAIFYAVSGGGFYAFLAQGLGEWAGNGASFGKVLFRTRVRMENLNRPTLSAALLRNLLIVVDGLFFGMVAYLGIKSSLMAQRFGDGLAQTVVARAPTLSKDMASRPWRGVFVAAIAAIVLPLVGTFAITTLIRLWSTYL